MQVALAVTALVLAMVGYERADAGAGTGPGAGGWGEHLYRSVALFAGDTSTLHDEPVLVTVARWLALVVTASAVVAVTLAVLERRAGSLMTRWLAHDHVVVAGDGPDVARIAAGIAASGRRVVLVSSRPDAAEAVTRKVALVHGSASSDRSLRSARVDRAAEVIVSMTNDAATTHAALVAARVATRGRVIGLLGDPVARSHLQERILGGGGHVVELVSLPEIAARQAIADLEPFTPSVRVAAILGAGPLAEALAVEAARAATAGDSRPRLRLAGFSPARLTATPGMSGRVEIVTPADPDPRALGTWLRAATGETRCYLCPPASIGDALAVADAGATASWCCCSSMRRPRMWRWPPWRCWPRSVTAASACSMSTPECTVPSCCRSERSRRSRAPSTPQYLRDELAKGGTMGSEPAMRAWEELDATFSGRTVTSHAASRSTSAARDDGSCPIRRWAPTTTCRRSSTTPRRSRISPARSTTAGCATTRRPAGCTAR